MVEFIIKILRSGGGHVESFEFSSGAWKGFVKTACEADINSSGEADPSVNHMIVVDAGTTSGTKF